VKNRRYATSALWVFIWVLTCSCGVVFAATCTTFRGRAEGALDIILGALMLTAGAQERS
jgi:hypothetical protein